MKQVTVSVVMATYNGEKYLQEQLESIIQQSEKPDEIIIVDDASKDRTVAIIEDFTNKFPFDYTIVIHESNLGVAQSFEDGLSKAKCEYVLICDQDDVWHQEKIKLTKEALKNGAVLAVCNAAVVNKNLEQTGVSMFSYIGLPIKLLDLYTEIESTDCLRMFLKRNYVTGMCMAGQRKLMLEAAPFPSEMVYDTWLAWNLAQHGKIVFINEQLVLYRQHDSNVIGTKKNKESLREYYSHRKKDKMAILNKYNSLAKVEIQSPTIEKELDQAILFHKERYELTSQNRFMGLKTLCKHVAKGSYRKYTSLARKEILKDTLEILFFRNV